MALEVSRQYNYLHSGAGAGNETGGALSPGSYYRRAVEIQQLYACLRRLWWTNLAVGLLSAFCELSILRQPRALSSQWLSWQRACRFLWLNKNGWWNSPFKCRAESWYSNNCHPIKPCQLQAVQNGVFSPEAKLISLQWSLLPNKGSQTPGRRLII